MSVDAREIICHIVEAVRNPEASFGSGSRWSAKATLPGGQTYDLRDELSVENGAAGAVWLLAAAGAPDASYSTFAAGRLRSLSSAVLPDRVGTAQGLSVIAAHFASRSAKWTALSRGLAGVLSERMKIASETILDCVDSNTPVPSMETYDGLRGLARDTGIYVRTALDPDIELVRKCLDVLSLLMYAGGSAWPVGVQGGPFLDMPFKPDFHWNFGTAHGMSGIAHALLAIGTWLDSRGGGGTQYHAVVESYVDWIDSVSIDGAPPSYAVLDECVVRLEPPQTRPSWCYGAVGHQLLRSVLAQVINDKVMAYSVQKNLLSAYQRRSECQDLSLCHGSAGLMVALRLAGVSLGDDQLISASTVVEREIIKEFDPALPYGFSYQPAGVLDPVDVPGLLNGAVGIAVALTISSDLSLDSRRASELIVQQSPWLRAPS